MIRIIPIFLTLFFSIPLFSDTKWINSMDIALEKARSENKPILIDLYTDWCVYCKDLENKIFPLKEVNSELEKYVTVRINGDESPDLVSKYQVRGYPTILFLDKNGYLIDKVTGLPTQSLLISKLQEAFIKKDVESGLLLEQKQSPDSFLPNYNLGLFYYRNGNFKDSSEFFLKSYNAKETDNQEKKPDALFLLGIIQIQERKFSEAISIWNSYLEKYPENKKGSVLYCRGISFYFSGKKREAKEDLLKAKDLSTSQDQLEKINMILAELEI